MSGSGLLRELKRSQKVDAAYQNEKLTRERVGHLEARVAIQQGKLTALETMWDRFSGQGFWGRLSWLLRGK